MRHLLKPLRRRIGIVCLGLTQAFVLGVSQATAESMSEPQLKAAFLVNFFKYVEWPPSSSGATICLLGQDAVGNHLSAYEGRTVAGSEIHIRRISRREEIAGCQQLYVGPGDESRVADLIKSGEPPATLVVGEGESFIRHGGAIALVRVDNRLAFDINLETTTRAKLRLSPQMLRVAREVIGGPR